MSFDENFYSTEQPQTSASILNIQPQHSHNFLIGNNILDHNGQNYNFQHTGHYESNSFDDSFYGSYEPQSSIKKNDKKKNIVPPNKDPKLLYNNDKFIKILFDDDTDSEMDEINDQICNNPLCDHMDYGPNEQKNINTVPISIFDITDLIKLGKTYHCKKNREYFGINLRILSNLVPPLSELNRLVGMKSVKEHIVNQIIFFLQGFNKNTRCNNCIDCTYNLPCPKNLSGDMLHTVITGPPGVGKTELGKILGKIYKAMGVLSNGTMRIVSRSDLIGKYLGHTAAKTQDVIDKCKGGVMFIDEAYALGNSEGRDSFSKECIDTLNQNLTEKRDFLCIIAGYKDALENCFFNYNEGLKRRFTFRYDITEYSPEELKNIFTLKVNKEGWKTEYNVESIDNANVVMHKHSLEQKMTGFFTLNMKYFPHFGGDIETFFLNCKIHHSRRVVFSPPEEKKILTFIDIENGFSTFVANRQYKEDDDHKKKIADSLMMY